MIESSIHSSSDEDSSNKYDLNQMPEPSVDSRDPHAHSVVSDKEPIGDVLAEPLTARVNIRSRNAKSCLIKDQKQDKDFPATSFHTLTPTLDCQVTSDMSVPSTIAPLISNDIDLGKNSEPAGIHYTSNALSRKTSAASVSSHHVSFLLSNPQTILILRLDLYTISCWKRIEFMHIFVIA